MPSVKQLAEQLSAQIVGDADVQINALATLADADIGQLSFFANPKYLAQLKSSNAQAVLVSPDHQQWVKNTALVVDNPYLAFAKATQLFDWRPELLPGIHASAVIHPSAVVDNSAQVAAGVVIGENSQVAAGCYIGPNTVIGRNCSIAANTRLEAAVVLYDDVHIGERCMLHSSAVLGADGFGFAHSRDGWEKICQLGGVRLGNDVEVGAGTTIDRGALADTQVGNGVKLDNQVQIAHNVEIGAQSAIAGCTAVAGSTKIGQRCTIAGMSGITGHLTLADGTHVTAMSLVSRSINAPGSYSSGTGIEPHAQWKKNVVRFRHLDELAKRVTKLEKNLANILAEGHTE